MTICQIPKLRFKVGKINMKTGFLNLTLLIYHRAVELKHSREIKSFQPKPPMFP